MLLAIVKTCKIKLAKYMYVGGFEGKPYKLSNSGQIVKFMPFQNNVLKFVINVRIYVLIV